MNGLIYLVGLIVVIMFVLSLLGLGTGNRRRPCRGSIGFGAGHLCARYRTSPELDGSDLA